MLHQVSTEELMRLPKYDRVMILLWRTLTAGMTAQTLSDELHFTSADIASVMAQAVRDRVIDKVANPPDIKYTYDARRDFPAEIEQCGPRTWLQNGKGRYKLVRTKRMNIIRLPGSLAAMPATQDVADQTTPFITTLLGNDEQAVFTRVRNAQLINDFIGFPAWPIQGHHRTTVTYGQIEVDEVQAGLQQGVGTIIPITGKGGSDNLSWSQALNLNTYGVQKAPRPGLKVRSLGLWSDDERTVWIVEFSPDTNIDDIEIVRAGRFRFV